MFKMLAKYGTLYWTMKEHFLTKVYRSELPSSEQKYENTPVKNDT
jgi:hypothetical protein